MLKAVDVLAVDVFAVDVLAEMEGVDVNVDAESEFSHGGRARSLSLESSPTMRWQRYGFRSSKYRIRKVSSKGCPMTKPRLLDLNQKV